jgi:hypothetical protein
MQGLELMTISKASPRAPDRYSRSCWIKCLPKDQWRYITGMPIHEYASSICSVEMISIWLG